jgi:hypothetical protein
LTWVFYKIYLRKLYGNQTRYCQYSKQALQSSDESETVQKGFGILIRS